MQGELKPRPLILSWWYRLPILVRSVLSGLVVFEVLQIGWFGSFLANTKYLPTVPWNVPVGLLYLWVVFRYFNGRGWPSSTAEARSTGMRAGRLSKQQWSWSLAYTVTCLIFMASIINVVYRFIKVPDEAQMDVSMFPWWSLYPSLIMLSINAGVSEEAGFRGYLQGGLERRYGPAIAIVFTSLAFWLAHLNHPTGLAKWVLLIGYGVALGALTWAVNSIWPAIVTHAATDAVSFTILAADWETPFMRKPALFAETGVDAPFVVFSALLVLSVLAGIAIIRRLKQGESSS